MRFSARTAERMFSTSPKIAFPGNPDFSKCDFLFTAKIKSAFYSTRTSPPPLFSNKLVLHLDDRFLYKIETSFLQAIPSVRLVLAVRSNVAPMATPPLTRSANHYGGIDEMSTSMTRCGWCRKVLPSSPDAAVKHEEKLCRMRHPDLYRTPCISCGGKGPKCKCWHLHWKGHQDSAATTSGTIKGFKTSLFM
jgi:hypothetical protein